MKQPDGTVGRGGPHRRARRRPSTRTASTPLIAIGGDGSLTIANALATKGLRVVGVPKTIDNDLDGTVITFGFDTAVSFATECIDRLHSTADSHRRVMVVEVMGRYAGWIALNSGVSGDGRRDPDPGDPLRHRDGRGEDPGARRAGPRLRDRRRGRGRAAEGRQPTRWSRRRRARPSGSAGRARGWPRRSRAATGKETRHVVLGHLLRGGSPTTFDRLISLRFGAAAVRALAAGKSGVMVALDPPTVRYVPLAEATRAHEGRAARLRHDPHRARARHLPRGLRRVSVPAWPTSSSS